MFVRKKLNKSGVISVQIIEKRSGKSTLVKTLGSSADWKQIAGMVEKGKQFINKIKGQSSFHFDLYEEQQLVDLFFNGIRALSLAGPELLLGKLFDEIGFNAIRRNVPPSGFNQVVLSCKQVKDN